MDPDSWLRLVFLLLGLWLAGLSQAIDTALRAVPHPRLEHLAENNDTRARLLERWQEQGDYFGGSTAVVGVVGLVLAGTMAVLLSLPYSLLGGVAAFAILLLLEQTAIRTLAFHNPEAVAMAMALPFNIFSSLFFPLAWLMAKVTLLWHRLFGTAGSAEGTAVVTEDELRAWVDAGEEAGILEEEEREMIDNVLELEETTAHEIMVPRPDIVAVEGNAPISLAADLVLRHGYSRLPVYQDTIDNILGIVYAKDLLREMREGRLDTEVKQLARPAYFVPESKKVNELLQELQLRKVHIALVVDEYGGIAGMLTIEDLLEEIVGEIQDEHDREEAKIQLTGEGEANFDATVSVDDVNETLGLNLQVEDVDTIGGLVYERLGQIPVPGDSVTADGALITVLTTSGRRIRRVRVVVQRPEQPSEESSGNGTASGK